MHVELADDGAGIAHREQADGGPKLFFVKDSAAPSALVIAFTAEVEPSVGLGAEAGLWSSLYGTSQEKERHALTSGREGNRAREYSAPPRAPRGAHVRPVACFLLALHFASAKLYSFSCQFLRAFQTPNRS